MYKPKKVVLSKEFTKNRGARQMTKRSFEVLYLFGGLENIIEKIFGMSKIYRLQRSMKFSSLLLCW